MTNAIHSITSIGAPFNMIVLIVLLMTIGTVIGTTVKQIRKYACQRQELEFKRDLLDRGMGAEEIERVVRARGPTNESDS
jgi:hypothetical protein